MHTVHHFLYNIYKHIALVDKQYFSAHVLGCDISQVVNSFDVVFNDSQYTKLQIYCNRRLQGEPVDTIIGIKGFWQGVFYVDKTVLSPRPDTETIIQAVMACCATPPKNILDMGTGSGCIIISLLQQYPNTQGVAVDISMDALRMACKNAVFNQTGDRMTCIQSDWWQNVRAETPFDVIVSNPPYIPSEDIAHLQPEVQNFDPLLALDGGKDGLTPYRILANIPDGIIADSGYMIVEFGINQHHQVADIFVKNGWKLCGQYTDISGVMRTQAFQKI